MKGWVFILLAAIWALPAEMIINRLSHLLWGRSLPPQPSRKGYVGLVLLFLCFTMAANQFNNAATEQPNKNVAQLPSAPAPAPAVIREIERIIYVPRESAPPQQEATPDSRNALTKVDPPSDKFPNQNVLPPSSSSELAKQQQDFTKHQQDLAEQRERDYAKQRRELEKRQDDKLKRQLILGIRDTYRIY